jgi:phage gpG-like protein
VQTVDIEVFGEPVLRRRLMRMHDAVTDAREAFRQVVGILERATRRNFASKGSYGGARWAELKPATLASKRRKGHDLRILRATGRLFASLTQQTHEDHVEDIGRTELRWGSSVEYGVYHQSRKPRTVIPFRPPVRLPESDRRSAMRELQRSVIGAA